MSVPMMEFNRFECNYFTYFNRFFIPETLQLLNLHLSSKQVKTDAHTTGTVEIGKHRLRCEIRTIWRSNEGRGDPYCFVATGQNAL